MSGTGWQVSTLSAGSAASIPAGGARSFCRGVQRPRCFEDSLHDAGVVDERDHPQRPLAARTFHWTHFVDLLDQARPRRSGAGDDFLRRLRLLRSRTRTALCTENPLCRQVPQQRRERLGNHAFGDQPFEYLRPKTERSLSCPMATRSSFRASCPSFRRRRCNRLGRAGARRPQCRSVGSARLQRNRAAGTQTAWRNIENQRCVVDSTGASAARKVSIPPALRNASAQAKT